MSAETNIPRKGTLKETGSEMDFGWCELRGKFSPGMAPREDGRVAMPPMEREAQLPHLSLNHVKRVVHRQNGVGNLQDSLVLWQERDARAGHR